MKLQFAHLLFVSTTIVIASAAADEILRVGNRMETNGNALAYHYHSYEQIRNALKIFYPYDYIIMGLLPSVNFLSCPNDTSRNYLDDAIAEAKACQDNTSKNLSTCSIVDQYGEKCVTQLARKIGACLPSENRQLPEFILEVIMKAIDNICHADGEKLFEFFNFCVYKTITVAGKSQCIDNIGTALYEASYTGRISVKWLCDFYGNAVKPCLSANLGETCAAPTATTITRFLDTAMSSCFELNKL